MTDNRLLVVDDDATTRFALQTPFSRQGWKVSVAATVAEAFDELCRTPAPRCVILDLNLPDGRGEMILRAVRDARLKTDVAVCSGVEDADRLSAVMAMHPEALLAKPLELGPIMHFCQASLTH